MKILLFLSGICFFFILYIFSLSGKGEEAIFLSLFIEANLYVGIALLFIYRVFIGEKNLIKNENEQESSLFSFIPKDISTKLVIKTIFEKYIYIIALILFYVSIYLFLQVFYEGMKIQWVFLLLNIIVIFLYTSSQKFEIFRDLARVNTSIISLYYIFLHIYFLSSGIPEFGWGDIGNIISVWLLFYLHLSSPVGKVYRKEFYSYIVVFLFLELLVLFRYFFGDLYYVFLLLASLFASLFLFYTKELSYLIGLEMKYIRIWGLCCACIYILFSFYLLYLESGYKFVFVGLGVYLSMILFLFHQHFQNYISLFFSCLGIFISSFTVYVQFFGIWNSYISFIFLGFSILLLLFSTIKQMKYEYDEYFFHIFSFIVNLVGALLFVLLYDLSILSVSIFCMGESLYLFYSYYHFKKINL